MRGVSIDVGLDRLSAYAREHGHANPPVRTVWLGWAIGTWVRELRRKKRLGILSAEQMSEAEQLGVDWDPPSGRRRQQRPPQPTREQRRETHLHTQLDQLAPYWHTNGDIDIRQTTGTDDWPQAGRFICRLRRLRRDGELPASIIERATKMGIV